MFSGFSKHKFYTKCKSSMKTMKCRMEVLKKKKNTVAKYLKNDMADLIRNGLDYNAYCRAEGLMVEQNILEAYDFIEKFCGCISNHLSAMDHNQRECPEECKEAVQSLIYATARVPEFPELKNLRTLFNDRYGTSEKLVNKEFMEKLNPKSATKDVKFQLMHDIAQEVSIEWNPKSLEQELFKAPLTRSNTDQEDLHEQESPENGHKLDENPKMETQIGTKEGEEHEHKLTKIRNESFSRRYGLDFKSRVEKVKELFLSKRNETEAPSGARKIASEDYTTSSSLSSFKTEAENAEANVEESLKSSSSNGEIQQDDSDVESKPKPRSVRRRPSNLSKYQALEETFSVESPLKRASGTENSNGVEKPLKPPLKRASGPENPNGVCGTRSPRATKSDTFEPEQRKTHARTASDMTRRYVHPNLPDCDELADRISFLKGYEGRLNLDS